MILFSFFFQCAFSQDDYTLLDKEVWSNCRTAEFKHNDLIVNYKYCSIDNKIPFDFIEKEIQTRSEQIFEFAGTIKAGEKECVLNSNLEIYQVSMVKLNSLSIVKDNELPTLYALYDPRLKEQNTSSIFLTNQGQLNSSLLLHELSHYWYDRLCWNRVWSDTEGFAQQVELHYLR